VIFVTVGSIHFDTLIQTLDEAIARGEVDGEVVMQIGNGTYLPKHCEYFRTAPGLAPYYEKADLVVGHGGTGTTLEVLERGLRLVSVSNPSMIDNHQHEFLDALERKGLILYCRKLAELPACIRRSLQGPPARSFSTGLFFRKVVDDLESL